MSDSKVKTFFRILFGGAIEVPNNAEYPPFDEKSRCPKCGSHGDFTLAGKGGHSVSFRPAHAESRGEGFFTWVPDLIRRGCSRCCAEWYELPLDAVKAAG